MVYNSIRASVFGRLVYRLSNYTYFTYPEEQEDYCIPQELFEISDKPIIIDWKDNDPEHPKNWPWGEKLLVYTQMTLLSFINYMGGPIYIPAAEEISKEFETSYVVSNIPLCLYIIGYGITQMWFSPMAELASIGRTPVYAVATFLLAIFQIPCALAHNITTLCVSRFLSGLFASPSLSVGGATSADITHTPYIPTALVVWGFAAFCGPSLGPIAGVGLMKSSWRNIFWFLFALEMGTTFFLIFFSPETNHNTLLLWKAQRLRRVIGNPRIVARCELEQVNTGEILVTITRRAFEIMAVEPIVLLVDVFQGLNYGCLYLWFEAFPIAYHEVYNFSTGGVAAAYNTIVVGGFCGACLYSYILYQVSTKKVLQGGKPNSSAFLDTACIGATLVTLSLFIFGWTVNRSIHWIVSLIGAGIFGAGCLIILQSNFNYLGSLYPRFVASVFGGNGMMRSAIGGTIPIYGRQMFKGTGTDAFPVGWGCSILGFIFIIFVIIPLIFKKYDKKLVKNSSYAGF